MSSNRQTTVAKQKLSEKVKIKIAGVAVLFCLRQSLLFFNEAVGAKQGSRTKLQ